MREDHLEGEDRQVAGSLSRSFKSRKPGLHVGSLVYDGVTGLKKNWGCTSPLTTYYLLYYKDHVRPAQCSCSLRGWKWTCHAEMRAEIRSPIRRSTPCIQ